jgi:hypothetical protein
MFNSGYEESVGSYVYEVIDSDSQDNQSFAKSYSYQAEGVAVQEDYAKEADQAEALGYPDEVEGYAVYSDENHPESYGFVPLDPNLPFARVHCAENGQRLWVEISGDELLASPFPASKSDQDKDSVLGSSPALSAFASTIASGPAQTYSTGSALGSFVLYGEHFADNQRRLAFDASDREGSPDFSAALE